MLRLLIIIGLMALPAFGTAYTCMSNAYTATSDIILTGGDSVSFVGTSSGNPCKVTMAGYRFWAKDGTWTGGMTLTDVILYDCGRIGFDCMNLQLTSSSALSFTKVVDHRSSSYAIQSAGTSTFSITSSTLCNTHTILHVAIAD